MSYPVGSGLDITVIRGKNEGRDKDLGSNYNHVSGRISVEVNTIKYRQK